GQLGADGGHRNGGAAPRDARSTTVSRDGPGSDDRVRRVHEVDEQSRAAPVHAFEYGVEARDAVEAVPEPGDVAPVDVGDTAGVAPQ
ncbi:hypothetical protein CN613_28205, partial [Bacillus pseudomycoides]